MVRLLVPEVSRISCIKAKDYDNFMAYISLYCLLWQCLAGRWSRASAESNSDSSKKKAKSWDHSNGTSRLVNTLWMMELSRERSCRGLPSMLFGELRGCGLD
ncbi:predicted protein [Pyrenophora tritici-repentis Pt-1C-BFP]|uniref:Uncharacterized protein n=1 Tax=Pyrenophora tritici-repentis (strain Pt-1C-BFP) TaxID=426418 RepID=B2WCI1_PYRTR|nr:uncharacterized protein PTRG_07690 [Pyrenophora tritici-repentis Pt-1C-BFP]EDU50609.1 predicted protein [Pyrenophora tritici-repentis Pt-1C-BFP]